MSMTNERSVFCTGTGSLGPWCSRASERHPKISLSLDDIVEGVKISQTSAVLHSLYTSIRLDR